MKYETVFVSKGATGWRYQFHHTRWNLGLPNVFKWKPQYFLFVWMCWSVAKQSFVIIPGNASCVSQRFDYHMLMATLSQLIWKIDILPYCCSALDWWLWFHCHLSVPRWWTTVLHLTDCWPSQLGLLIMLQWVLFKFFERGGNISSAPNSVYSIFSLGLLFLFCNCTISYAHSWKNIF